MITYFDRFVDTKAKRYHLYFIFFAILLITLILPYVFLGISLVQVDRYDKVFALLEHPFLLHTYLSRIVLAIMAIGKMSIIRVIREMIIAFNIREVLAVIMFAIGFYPISQRKATNQCLVLIVIELMIVFICCILGLQSTTLNQGIIYIRILGISFIIIFSLLLFIIIKQLHNQFVQYRDALRYDCVELPYENEKKS